jgi:hypothetical protein
MKSNSVTKFRFWPERNAGSAAAMAASAAVTTLNANANDVCAAMRPIASAGML